MWPTSEAGGFQCRTAVYREADARHVLSNAENTARWTTVLEFCAKAVEAQGRYIFPYEGEMNDHPRIGHFLEQWSAYSVLLSQPEHLRFAQAVTRLRVVWEAAAGRPLRSLADVGAVRARLESRTLETPDEAAAMPAPPPPPLSTTAPSPPPPPPLPR